MFTAGDHDLVVGEVVDFEGSGGEPLIFHRGAFGGLDEDALVPQRPRDRHRRRLVDAFQDA